MKISHAVIFVIVNILIKNDERVLARDVSSQNFLIYSYDDDLCFYFESLNDFNLKTGSIHKKLAADRK